MTQEVAISKPHGFFFSSTSAESGRFLLKKFWHTVSKQQEAVLNSGFIVCMCVFLEFHFKLSQVLCGFSMHMLEYKFVVRGLLVCFLATRQLRPEITIQKLY